MKKINLLFKLAVFSSFLSVPLSAFSEIPPPWCVEDYSPSILDNFSGSKYVAIGVPVQYKADLQLPNGIYRNVYFYSSEDGYIGDDNSGLEGNAYKNITFDQMSSIGSGKVWGEIDGYCVYKNVNVHTLPTGNAISLSGGSRIQATLSASIHTLSKNVVEGNGSPGITYRFFNEIWRINEIKTTTSQSIYYYPRYNGPYRVTATISDGTYSKTISLGSTFYTGGTSCNTCGQLP